MVVGIIAVLAGILGYALGILRSQPPGDILAVLPAHEATSSAYEAYRHEKPEVAIWALEQAASKMTALVGLNVDSPWYTREDLNYDLMLTHARIAQLYESLRDQRSEDHFIAAVRYGKHVYPTEHVDRARLLALLDTHNTFEVGGKGK